MKVSLNSIRKLNQRYHCADEIAPQGPQALADRIGAQLGAIEEVIDIGSKYKGIIIVKVISCEKHPGADRLNVCKIDDGGVAEGVERDGDGLVQVVCGAPNVRAGLTVAWLPPGSTVPESVGKDPFVLGSRELRGVLSNGMLASPKELTLGESHEGILEIDEAIAPGTDFAEHYGLAGDVVYDIENKMFTHRPDCFGFLGVAREIAGIQQMAFKSPDWYRLDVVLPDAGDSKLPLTVRNEIPAIVPRFSAITMSGVTVKASPVWLQVELVRAGLRPINNIVDLTNYFMLETGQPLHAYDYDKVRALDNAEEATIVVRHPQPGETIRLLNGKEIEPRAEAAMIASQSKLIGVGGVMGGADTEVDESTKNIIIEVANFDMYSVRRTSMAHGLFSDAVSRFNKGQSPLQTMTVLAKMVDDVSRLAGGQVASQPIDDNHLADEVRQRGTIHSPVRLPVSFINQRLGLQLSASDVESLLSNVEFSVQLDGEQLEVLEPFWRTDIELPEDIVEEVGRLYGFDRLPLELPRRAAQPAPSNSNLRLKQQLRDILSRAGANEVLTYSFAHGKLLEKAGQNPEQAYKLSNALSPDLQYYRLGLTPSLLDKVHQNSKAGYHDFALYELGKVHAVGLTNESDGLPAEPERLSLVLAADAKTAANKSGASYYQARKYLDWLLACLNVRDQVTYKPLTVDAGEDMATAFYQPGRAAAVWVGEDLLGYVGEYKPTVRRSLKLPDYCAGFEVDSAVLLRLAGPPIYRPLPRFPKIEQDISLRVPAGMAYADLYDFVYQQLLQHQPQATDISLSPLDIYQHPDNEQAKQITLRLSIASHQRTLRDSEVAALLDAVAAAAAESLGAERL